MATRSDFFITKQQAQALIEAHEIDQLVANEEEFELLKENNPDLLDAYICLRLIAHSE